MKLYRIWQVTVTGYDTYDSAVVAARSEDEARKIHPGSLPLPELGSYTGEWWNSDRAGDVWAKKPEQVNVELIGSAVKGTKAGVICASFNAG